MHLSNPTTITFRGQPAELRAVRNNGMCWGIITDADGKQYDVDAPEDLYDHDDSYARNRLEECANDEALVNPR